ncbi:hypothetical protein LOZ53_000867 [Ophidiomyces ophidiicola]|uniref:Uncharacterized protein n=1 Tax=Ophidiomyces ophidiicola TaxID=1387563 RepID=A0ACB8V6D8_9EURO|nr:hypothetical protein LOZ61_001300 [Ophidiomyces ophidiicola]KAI1923049.1 hypothetical protein LOZ64_001136 [Ophidiomyces ophidiicola]KAI1930611.1 hypothetical protein LOZ60_000842 [Ophidiomyces ophidiicola]KAI1977332.1 hypothetical protein LOZ55_003568 [Ophidiomyces ophidiicola]KAI1985878.1 hypothetical protein LOZ51_006226 [Ophidiomyces ophidiicola]
MPPNKDRLYIALFAHSRPDAYHWAFLVSPKENSNSNYQTIQYHATNRIQLRDGMMKATWELERVQLGKSEPVRLLARILIGKVERSRDELDKSLESVAVVQDDPNWRCRTWAEHALTQLGKDKILSKVQHEEYPGTTR